MSKKRRSPFVNGTYDKQSSRSPGPHFGANYNITRSEHGQDPQCTQKKRIEEPSENDVLYGRGGAINNHKGNVRFRSIVSDKKETYNSCTNKASKTEISRSIIQMIKVSKGRFLEKEQVVSITSGETELSGWWVEVGDAKAMSKTSQALREGAPNLRAQAEGTDTPESGKVSPNELISTHSKFSRKSRSIRPRNEVESLKSQQATHPRITFLPDGHRGKHLILKPSEDKCSGVTESTLPSVKKSRCDDFTATQDKHSSPEGNATTARGEAAPVVMGANGTDCPMYNSLGLNNNELDHKAKLKNLYQYEKRLTFKPSEDKCSGVTETTFPSTQDLQGNATIERGEAIPVAMGAKDTEFPTRYNSLGLNNNELDHTEKFRNLFQDEECTSNTPGLQTDNLIDPFQHVYDLDKDSMHDILPLFDSAILDESRNTSMLDPLITDESSHNDKDSSWSGQANLSS